MEKPIVEELWHEYLSGFAEMNFTADETRTFRMFFWAGAGMLFFEALALRRKLSTNDLKQWFFRLDREIRGELDAITKRVAARDAARATKLPVH